MFLYASYPALVFTERLIESSFDRNTILFRPPYNTDATPSDPSELDPLQTAFAEEGAAQCGYCTPGILLAAKALLERTPHPTRAEMAEAISGNLCRCTGYTAIYEAIERAARDTPRPA